METYTVILLSFGLASDAFAVSVARGTAVARFRFWEALTMATLFGLFQAIMPLLGWTVGLSFKDYIVTIDHWVAFILLAAIGGNMIYQDKKSGESEMIETTEKRAPLKFWTILGLAVATSVDALVVGLGFIVLDSIIFLVITVGLITFAMSAAGVYFGHQYKHLVGAKVTSIGGAILILIGSKILIEHLLH